MVFAGLVAMCDTPFPVQDRNDGCLWIAGGDCIAPGEDTEADLLLVALMDGWRTLEAWSSEDK